jgi:hypothetical protein
MTFKELTQDMLDHGWRAYHISDIEKLTRGDNLHKLSIRNLLQIQVYEGKKIVFVKNAKPLDDDNRTTKSGDA